MNTITEIETAIRNLSSPDLAALRTWFDEFAAQAWDRQIEEDAASGRLDELYERLRREDDGQPEVALNEFLDDDELS